MDSSQFSSGFPVGLRVLLVDNDFASLTNFEKMLKKCKYEVTSTSSAEEASRMVVERKDSFDIVMCDLKENVFQFVEHVHKLNIPVIMSSGDGETSRVMRGVAAGACDYLVKPLRFKEVKNIWQHVLRKKIKEDKHCLNEILNTRNLKPSCIKRKNPDSRENEAASNASDKKPRLRWSAELQEKFVQVVNRIGLDKAGPKKILEMMGDRTLTRENVASHLQKYRLGLKSHIPPVAQNTQNSAMCFAPVTQNTQNSAMCFAPVTQNTQNSAMWFPQQNIQILQPHCHFLPHPAVSNTLPPRQQLTNQQLTNQLQPPIPSSIDIDELVMDSDSYALLYQLMNIPTPPPKLTDLESSSPYTTNQQQQ